MIATVRDVARGGFGVLPGPNGPVMVPRVLTGEKVRFRVTHRRRGVDWGEVREILYPSPHRASPPCEYYHRCGGCNLQHASADHQLTIKSTILQKSLKRLGGLTSFPQPVLQASPPFHYRTRMMLQVKRGKVGFFQHGSHRLIEITACPLMPEIMQAGLRECVAHPRIRSLDTGQLALLTNGREVSAGLRADRQWSHIAGPPRIAFSLHAGTLSIEPRHFVQANRFTLAAMQNFAQPRARGIRTGADLFAGTGFLTLGMARKCGREGWAVESDPHNLAMLRANLETNGIHHVRTLGKQISGRHWPQVDFIIADPPRKGLSPRTIEALNAFPPREMVLFACDVATFSRDLSRLLAGGFSLLEMELIDNFPQSDHMEIAVRLKGRDATTLKNQGRRKSGQN